MTAKYTPGTAEYEKWLASRPEVAPFPADIIYPSGKRHGPNVAANMDGNAGFECWPFTFDSAGKCAGYQLVPLAEIVALESLVAELKAEVARLQAHNDSMAARLKDNDWSTMTAYEVGMEAGNRTTKSEIAQIVQAWEWNKSIQADNRKLVEEVALLREAAEMTLSQAMHHHRCTLTHDEPCNCFMRATHIALESTTHPAPGENGGES